MKFVLVRKRENSIEDVVHFLIYLATRDLAGRSSASYHSLPFLIFSARKFHASDLPLFLLPLVLDDRAVWPGKASVGAESDGRNEGVRSRDVRGQANRQGARGGGAIASKHFRQPSGRDFVRPVGVTAFVGRRCSLGPQGVVVEWA